MKPQFRLILAKIAQKAPLTLKKLLRVLGVQQFLNRRDYWNKHTAELAFQTHWVEQFVDNKAKVLEYWEGYRYLDEIKKICSVKPDTKILDVGCGISTVLHFVEGERYGIDPLALEYQRLYSYPARIRVLEGSGEKIPFNDNSFGVVFCSDVLDHVDNPQQVLSEIARVLQPEGFLVLTVEIFPEDFHKEGRDIAHPHNFSVHDINELVEGDFGVSLDRSSPWISLSGYIQGKTAKEMQTRERVMVLQPLES